MNPVIRLRQGVAVIPCESGVQLRWGDEAVHVLESSDRETLTRLLSMIDGQNTEASFIERALEPWRGLAKQLLVELKSANLLVYGAPPPNETIGCLEKYGVSGESFEQAILSTKVNLWGPASVCAKAKSMLLQHSVECGNYQEISADLFDCTLMVVVQKAPDLSAMLSMNQELIAKQIAALWVDLSHGSHATIGPFYVPRQGACYQCMRTRLRENTASFEELSAAENHMLSSKRSLPAVALLPAWVDWATSVAVTEVVAFITKTRPLRTFNRAVTISFDSLEMWSEPVWQVPWCACSSHPP